MINGTVKGLNNVRHVPKFGRNLILLTWIFWAMDILLEEEL